MKKSFIPVLVGLFSMIFIASGPCVPEAKAFEPLMLQRPTMNENQIAFAYGGEIWIVSRDGGNATRLVTGTGLLGRPIFSPDGQSIAYTGNYHGNIDVYMVPTAGGEPKRLTYHPGPDIAIGWTPDGTSILFT